MTPRSYRLAVALALAAGAAADDTASCTNCGMCYNIDDQHRLECIESAEECQGPGRFYAPYACPPGIDCQQTNYQPARECDEFDTCCGDPAATWGSQQAELPEHSWIVLDHAPGTSFGLGVTATDTHVFSAGSMDQSIELKNAATGDTVTSTHEGPDRDLFLASILLDGTPSAIYTYPSTEDTSGGPTSYPRDLHASPDGTFVAMAGYFFGAIVFDDTTITNEKTERSHADGFVAKIRASNGKAKWAYHRTATESTQLLGVNFDPQRGHVAFCGSHKDLGELTTGVVGLLEDSSGELLWEKTWGDGVRPFGEVAFGDGVLVAVGSMQGAVDFGGDVGTVETAADASGAPVIEALMLGLDPRTGEPKWITRVTTDDGTTSSFGLVEVVDGYAYASCSGGCAITVEQDGDRIAAPAKEHGGAIVKLNAADGELEWSSDVPSPLGMAVAPGDGHVYAQIMATSPTFGDMSFQSMGGSSDQYVVKIDKASGRGLWALQQGGNELEYLRRMCVDGNGDVYTTGMTGSDPIHFDPLMVDSHLTPEDSLRDLFVAKLAASTEALPSCKTDATRIAPGSCFIGNVCYDDGEAGRGVMDCMACDAANPDQLTGPGAGFCFIGNTCQADGAPRMSGGGRGPPTVSECAYCDPAAPMDWSVRPGFSYDPSQPAGSDCTAAAETAKPAMSPGGCTHCGACYNRNGAHRIECIKEYDAQCMAYYAPYECPPGADCFATNDETYGLPCLDQLPGCYGPDEACDTEPEPEPECTFCGACYKDETPATPIRDGETTCVKEYDETCHHFYAPFDCPPGVTCAAENDALYGQPCLAELKGCWGAEGPSGPCDPDARGPSQKPTITPPDPRPSRQPTQPSPAPGPTSPNKGNKKKKSSSDDDALAIGLGVGAAALVLLVVGLLCMRKAPRKKQQAYREQYNVENEMTGKAGGQV